MEIKLGKYRHYKGKMYEVIGVGKHADTLQKMVAYKALYDSEELGDNAVWFHSLENFLKDVEVNGKVVPRFEYVED